MRSISRRTASSGGRNVSGEAGDAGSSSVPIQLKSADDLTGGLRDRKRRPSWSTVVTPGMSVSASSRSDAWQVGQRTASADGSVAEHQGQMAGSPAGGVPGSADFLGMTLTLPNGTGFGIAQRSPPDQGPGLAIRCPGEITREKLDILREADAVYIDQIRKAGLYDKIWQAFAVLLPVKTVGVMGDGRTYEYVVGLRAVTSTDGMTADFYAFDMKFLGETATRIINEVKGVNRVVYDVTSKPPGTIEWE